nr:cilia- and flagella-associated protein 52 [Leptinotarsa decemlineata]
MSEAEPDEDVHELKVKAIIGFDGGTNNGLIVHPNRKHLLYPLGNKVAIQEWSTKKQAFLVGHTNIISSIAVSRSGKYVASGQINHIGFKARVIIWDFEKLEMVSQHEHHKVRVEAVTFSKDDRYVITLGGRDCGSVIIWDIKEQQVICGSQVSRGIQGEATVIQSMSRRGACFITAGEQHLAVWRIDKDARNVKSINVALSKTKRAVLCLDTNERDEFCYCGTSTGDVLKIRLFFHHDIEILEPVKQPSLIGCWARLTRKKLPRGSVDLYQLGVRSIRILSNSIFVVGAGNGTLEMVEETEAKVTPQHGIKFPSVPALKVLKSTSVNGAVTSLQLLNQTTLLAATDNSEIYMIRLDDFNAQLMVTCHTSSIYDVTFPYNFSEVFATAGKNDVRVWSMSTMEELLRIRVQNFICSSVVFAYDGKSILTGWSDGIIRSFTPLTGRLIYAILNAHNKGVSSLAVTSDGKKLISGGCEGQVRLWEVSPYRQDLICTLKEHKGPVSAIHINKFDSEAASASTDGTCIIWDLERQCRRQILFANTLFMCVRYFTSGVQILTGGSDRKLSYWEVLDGSLVRELEGSPSGTINALDISPDGERFVSGGNDQIIKVWKYQEGVATHIGVGHAAVVTATRFSADGKFIVTCDASGSVFVWECPQDPPKIIEKPKETEKAETLKTPEIPIKKEEDIRDLPSVRSSKSGSGKKKGADDECKCSTKSSTEGSCQGSARSLCSDMSAPSNKSRQKTNQVGCEVNRENSQRNSTRSLYSTKSISSRESKKNS